MNEVEQKARELKSFMAPAGFTDDAEIKREMEALIKYAPSYSLTDEEKDLIIDAAELIISELENA